ncbi:MAG: hypothetical protein J6U10_07300 [Lachnospiraceae bacterium]|nr:hypothetical protein [Lachnospiraceae bacterium]
MPENIEKFLRAIHILISRGDIYENNKDRVIISKRELFDVLEQLNIAVAEVMDNYEASAAAKARAKREVEETGMEIVREAQTQAEDIYAASILYTDGALNELYDEITEAKAGLKSEFVKAEKRLDERLEVIKQNQKDLMDTLKALQQGDKYFGLIEDYNRRLAIAEKQRELRDAIQRGGDKKEQGPEKPKSGADMKGIDDIISGKAFEQETVIPETFKKRKGEPHAMGEAAHTDTDTKFEKSMNSLLEPDPEDLEEIQWPDEPEQVVAVDVQINSNWRTGENNFLATGRAKTKKERDREKKHGKKPEKKKSKYDFDDEEITLTVEPEEDPDAPRIITSLDLDAEYEQWQNEQTAKKKTP